MKPPLPLLHLAAAAVALTVMTGCHDVDTDRIPLMAVRVPFATVGDWNSYGISGAATTRSFIRQSGVPAGYPYTGLSATGFGGVLLTGTFSYSGDPHLTPPAAFDLACPVEARADVRVQPDYEELVARCQRCGSTYDIFNGNGMPLSGPALHDRYGLRRYRVTAGAAGEYLIITN